MTTVTVALPSKYAAWHGWLMAGFTIFCFSIAPPLLKYIILQGVDPSLLVAMRYVVSALLLFSTIAVVSPKKLRIDSRGLVFCVITGLCFSAAILSFTWSLTWISASVASMIVSVYPLVVLVLLFLRGERVTRRHIVRLMLGLGGIYLLVGPGGPVELKGVVLVLGTCLAFAFYMVFMQWFLKGYSAQTVMLYMVATIAVVSLLMWGGQGAPWQPLNWQSIVALVIMVVFSTYLGQLALFIAVRHIGSGQMALLNPIEPLLTLIWSYLLLQEQLTLMQWAGGLLILLSMILAINTFKRGQGMKWRSRLRF